MIFDESIPSAVTRKQAKILAEYAAGQIVLEIGSHFGRSTILLASVARHVHAVDHHRGDPHAGIDNSLPMFLANIARHKMTFEQVTVHLGDCRNVLPRLVDGGFGMAFIDGAHDAASVVRDIMHAMVLVGRGAVICHDWPLVEGAARTVTKDWRGEEDLGILEL